MISTSVVLYNEYDLEEIVDQMSIDISFDLKEKNPIILCVMNGGMPFTNMLMSMLPFPLQFDFCQVSRYNDNEIGGVLHWKHRPEIDMTDRVVLICDDIYDEGVTLAAIREFCASRGAKEVKTAVLFNKIRENKLDIKIDYVGDQISDQFIFGFGLDLNGYFRNLPEVRVKL
jgi:hypoxanthine phosphoribosyltransferase